jgi:hypothetical protein
LLSAYLSYTYINKGLRGVVQDVCKCEEYENRSYILSELGPSSGTANTQINHLGVKVMAALVGEGRKMV